MHFNNSVLGFWKNGTDPGILEKCQVRNVHDWDPLQDPFKTLAFGSSF